MSDAELDVVATYRRYYPLLLRKCERMLDGAQAAEIAQETFTRLWHSRASLRDPRRVVGWLYTTSTRLAVERLQGRCGGGDTERLAAPPALLPDRIVEARRDLERLAGQLDAESLQLLVLIQIDGLGQREAATLLGCTERTVRRRLVRLEAWLERFREVDRG